MADTPDNKITQDKPLRLLVATSDDLAVLSALLQDGLVSAGDIHFDEQAGELLLVIDRYRWENQGTKERVLMGVKIGHVTKVQAKAMQAADKDNPQSVFYNLLHLAYEQDTKDNHHLMVSFSAGSALRLTIGKLAISASDIAPPRPAMKTPDHNQ